MTGYLGAPPGAIMVAMCHISHHWYRDDAWSRGRMWIDDAPEPAPRDPDLRVSQAERDEVVKVLAGHFADGRLTVEEDEEGVGAGTAGARRGAPRAPPRPPPGAPPPPARPPFARRPIGPRPPARGGRRGGSGDSHRT